MTLFQGDGVWPSAEVPRRGPQGTGRRVAVWMSVLAAVAGGVLLLTALPSGPLAGLTHYTMSAEMTAVADGIPFTAAGRDIFEAAQPQLLSDAPFRQACDGTPEGGGPGTDATIGCFYGSGGSGGSGRIAIFEPADERLSAQVSVTAAHEFLHAAYHQLTRPEREQLDALLAARWGQVAADDPLQQSLAFSVGGDDRHRATEEFAYLGSQVADVGAELEAFYTPYFTDRQGVVAFDTADRTMWNGVDANYQASLAAVTAADQAAADAAAQSAADRAQLQGERAQLEIDRQIYNQQVAQYNALSDAARLSTSISIDGAEPELLGGYLARMLGSFTARDDALAARDAELTADDGAVMARQSEAAAARLEAERLRADYEQLIGAMTPQ